MSFNTVFLAKTKILFQIKISVIEELKIPSSAFAAPWDYIFSLHIRGALLCSRNESNVFYARSSNSVVISLHWFSIKQQHREWSRD